MSSKNSSSKSNFYLLVLNALKFSTNLSKIQKDLSISKQKLNYYIRQLKRFGLIMQKGRGWYEVVTDSKNLSNHDILLKKDSIRGHAYVWEIELPQEIEDWKDRINILKRKGIHFKLIGAKNNTPRIKVLGRKIWLCNTHLRVYDKPLESYYGENATQSRNYAFNEILLVCRALERKLGITIKPEHIKFRKEHYALIKNDLAIEENQQGNIVHVSDEFGRWLSIDDSLGQGGELENDGHSSYKINIPMQKWWNIKKKYNFEITDEFLLERFNKFDERDKKFMEIIEKLELRIVYLTNELNKLK